MVQQSVQQTARQTKLARRRDRGVRRGALVAADSLRSKAVLSTALSIRTITRGARGLFWREAAEV